MFFKRLQFLHKIIFFFVLFLVLSLFLPLFPVENVESLLTAATFIFAVLYGFEISMAIGNFNNIKTQLAIENADLVSIHRFAKIRGGEIFEKIDCAVEAYLMKAIDYPLTEHLQTEKEFSAIFEPLCGAAQTSEEHKNQALQYIFEAAYYLPQTRNLVATFAPRFVTTSVWVMLIVLASILVLLILLNRGSDLLSVITTAIFCTTIAGSLVLLNDIDSNAIQERELEYEEFNKSLKAIGKTHYYPEFAIRSGIIKPPRGVSYRKGIFPEFPALTNRERIVVVG